MSNILSVAEFKLTRIAKLNNSFRTTFKGGRVVLDDGVCSLPEDELLEVLNKVKTFDDFNNGNDPLGERAYGAFEHNNKRYHFKIEYYDPTFQFRSEDPASAEKTTRVLTVLLPTEW